MPPGEQVRVGVDHAVVAHPEELDRVDLEVQMGRGRFGVAAIPDEPDDVARVNVRPVVREGRIGGEVRVVELVSLEVAQPETVAAERVPADEEECPVGNGEEGRPARGEDVVPVVPNRVCPRDAEIVAEGGGPVDREDVSLRGQLWVDA